MKNKTYYILRHGKTQALKRHHRLGWYGIRPANASILIEGHPQIKKMALFLQTQPVDLGLTSEFLRCRQTAKFISAKTKTKFVIDNRLNDLGLETFWQFRNRIKKLLLDTQSSKADHIIICTHGFVIAALVHLLTTGNFQLWKLFDFPPPGVLITIKGKGIDQKNF